MGILQQGESVLIVVNNEADPMVLEAINRALNERKVTPHIKFVYELLGKTQGAGRRDGRRGATRAGHPKAGIYQASQWVEGQFPNPAEPKAWLKARRPDLYKELFPGETGEIVNDPAKRQRPRGEGAGGEDADTGAATTTDYRSRNAVGEGIKKYLTTHPEIRGVFWGGGGSTGLRRQLYPMRTSSSACSSRTTSTTCRARCRRIPATCGSSPKSSCSSRSSTWIAWRRTIRRASNLWADITEEMAQRWAQGAYQRGHLYMFPNQATGRFGYSFVNYPRSSRNICRASRSRG